MLVQQMPKVQRLLPRGACSVSKGSLISSIVFAKKGLVARIVGTDSTKACRIRVGKDQFVHEELDDYKKQLIEIREKVSQHEEKRQGLLEQMQFFQNEETRLAHEQDTSRVELESYRKKLDSLEGIGKEGKIQDIEYQISRLQRNMEYAERKLAEAFQNNEEVERQVKKMDALIENCKAQMDTIRGHRQTLIQWSLDNPGKPVAKVIEMVHAGTKIQGLESEIIIRESSRAVRFTEMKGQSGYEIKSSFL